MSAEGIVRAIARRTPAIGRGRVLALAACLAASLALTSPAAAACLEGDYSDAGLAGAGPGVAFTIVAGERYVPLLVAQGFREVECAGALALAAGRQRRRDEICALAYSVDEARMRQMLTTLGTHPGLLCSAAEEEAGTWSGEKFSWSYRKGESE